MNSEYLQVKCDSELFYTFGISSNRIIFFLEAIARPKKIFDNGKDFPFSCNEQIRSLIPRSVSVSKCNYGLSHSKWVFKYIFKNRKSFWGRKKTQNFKSMKEVTFSKIYTLEGMGLFNIRLLGKYRFHSRPLKAKTALWQLSEGHLVPFS